MNTAKVEHLGETAGCADHDHDLVHELSERLDALWRYDQYFHNAKGHKEIEDFWVSLKAQEQKNVDKLKSLVASEVKKGCF